jgi:tRNA U34 5-methylaminomethyl-2-thiouridine-forming methyltransferase MnmC
LLTEELNETYHCFHGAKGESKHVFIQEGLNDYLFDERISGVTIFEVGFGTGLNAWLVYEFARQNPEIIFRFVSVETHPVPENQFTKFNYTADPVFQEMHKSSWNKAHQFENFYLTKLHYGLEEVNLKNYLFDVVFYDAFAPSKQPEMWSKENLRKCYEYMKPGGYLVTYCAKGQFKRDLAALGFEVQTLPGAMGKKEMVRAVKLAPQQ